MFYNLKLACRNLRNNGLYSVINIAGLAVSLTVVILIMLWVQDELSFDRFHPHAKNIYQLNAEVSEGSVWTNTPAPIAIAAKNEFSEIEQACRIGGYGKGYFDYNNKKFYNLKGAAVDDAFFTMFNFPLIKGDSENPFSDNRSMILSETKAKALFGNENPVGKIIVSHDDMSFLITGVMKDMPENSSFKYDYIVPFSTLQLTFPGNDSWKVIDEDWGSYNFKTYFLLHPEINEKAFADKIGKMVDRIRGDNTQQYKFILQPLLKIHLYSPEGEPLGMNKVWMFGIIAALILLIACINYVNLVTGRAMKRRREMGVRKVMGAKKSNLVSQMMNETVLLFLVSIIISTLLVYILLPFYNELAGKEMVFSIFSLPLLLIYGITTLSVILLAGLYPAFFIASFNPLEAFRNKSSGSGSHGYFRKSLVVFQFICAFGLIVSTTVVSKQLDYMRNKDLGYNSENVFTMWSGKMGDHYDAMKNELIKNKDIIGVSAASFENMGKNGSRTDISWAGKAEDYQLDFSYGYARPDFFELMGMPLVMGEYPAPTDSSSILINEEAARKMGIENPIGFEFNNFNGVPIEGVLKDYNFQSLNEQIKPLIIGCSPDASSYIYLKTSAGGAKSAISTAEKLWKQYNPDYEFSYSFLDEAFDNLYKSDIRSGKLFSIFAFVAIFVSCLGLFGLVTYTAETKTKEIGIRKVLGASVSNIVSLLSKEFLILVSIAMIIAFPLAYYFLNKILQDYAYRISISWWMFGIAAIITIALTLLTVGWQAIKAATANPVKSIKTE